MGSDYCFLTDMRVPISENEKFIAFFKIRDGLQGGTASASIKSNGHVYGGRIGIHMRIYSLLRACSSPSGAVMRLIEKIFFKLMPCIALTMGLSTIAAR